MVPVLHPEEIDGLITMKEAIRVVEAGFRLRDKDASRAA